MKKKILIVMAVLVGIGILLAPVVYFTRQKTQEPELTGPNPTKEYQKFVNDKTITKIYTGVLPCEDCDGIESFLTISWESEDAKEGKFTLSNTYLGSEKDTEISTGVWSLKQDGKTDELKIFILVFSDNLQREFEQVGEERLVEIDKNGKRVQEGGKDLALILLN